MNTPKHTWPATLWLALMVIAPLSFCLSFTLPTAGAVQECVDFSNDPAGCQPSTFDTPIGQMPSVRVNREGDLDPFSSEEDAKSGALRLEEELNLFRNFEHLHWVITVPSEQDPGTGQWRGGDLDGGGDARGLGIAGDCIYVGHRNGPGSAHSINIFKIQADPETTAPVQVGEIPPMVVGNQGFDDRELRALVYETSGGEDRLIVVRNAGTNNIGRIETYRADMNTCLPVSKSETYDFNGPSHEFFLWHDPANSNRVLVYVAMFSGGGLPDPENPGLRIPDGIVLAITDEETGEVLARPQVLAGFSLQEVGGPPINERADETGLFGDGRFADFSHLTNRSGRGGNFQDRQNNMLHSLSVSDDGDRVYVAGGNAGFYVLNSEAIAGNSNAQLADGTASCNPRSTIVSANGFVDASRLAEIANDCLHMVVSDDAGLQAFLASDASDAAKAARYLVLLTRSRLDVHPPYGRFNNMIIGLPEPIEPDCREPYKPVQVIDESDPANPEIVGLFPRPVPPEDAPYGDFCLSRGRFGTHNTHSFIQPGRSNPNLIATTHFNAGVRITDISDPSRPREVAWYLPPRGGEMEEYNSWRRGDTETVFIEWDRNLIWVGTHRGSYCLSCPALGTPVLEPRAVERWTVPHGNRGWDG